MIRYTESTDPLMYKFFDIVKKCSFRQFKDYMDRYMGASYEAGLREGEHEGITWDSDDLYELIVSEGVERKVAARIVDRIIEEGSGTHENV